MPTSVIAYWPTLIRRPVRARRWASISRRGSHCRAMRSILGVALCCRASDRVTTASTESTPRALSRIPARRLEAPAARALAQCVDDDAEDQTETCRATERDQGLRIEQYSH